MSERELSTQSFNTLVQFALKNLTGTEKTDFPRGLEMSVEHSENNARFKLNVLNDEKFSSVSLYYSSGVSHPKNRSWTALSMKKDKGEYYVNLDTSNMSGKLVAFANAVRGGCVFSTPVEYFTLPSNVKVRNDGRILFDGRQGGTGAFTSNTGGLFWNENDCQLKSGPFDIEGLSSEAGFLQSFIFQDASHKPAADSILTFDVFCDDKRDFVVSLYSEDGIRYYTEVHVDAAFGWQKISLPSEGFKRDDRTSLNGWKDIIKITFENIKGLIFNNILWL